MSEEKLSRLSTIVLSAAVALGFVTAAGRLLVAVVSVVMFIGGAVGMAVALVLAAQRSRESVIGVGDIFFKVPRPLLALLAVQVVVGFASAGVHPNTGAAFAILAPVAALGLCGLWGARHGTFPARET